MGATSSKRPATIETLYTSTSAFNTFAVDTIHMENWKQTIPEFIKKVVEEYRNYFVPSLAFLRKNGGVQKEQEYTQKLFVEPLLRLYQQIRDLAALSRNYPVAFQTQINTFYYEYYKRQTLSFVMLYEREKIYLALAHILELKFFNVLTKLTNIKASTMKIDADKTIAAYKEGLRTLLVEQMKTLTDSIGRPEKDKIETAAKTMGANITAFNQMTEKLATFFGVKPDPVTGGGVRPPVTGGETLARVRPPVVTGGDMAPAHGSVRVMGSTAFPPKVNTADIRDVMFDSFHNQIKTSIAGLSSKANAFYNACFTLYKESVEYVVGIVARITSMLVLLQKQINIKVDEANKALAKVTTEIQRINAQFYKEVTVSDLRNVEELKKLIDEKVTVSLNELQSVIDAVEKPPAA